MPTAYPAVGACFWFARSEDSNSCEGDRRLRRKQGAGAGAAVAEAAARSRGARRCGNRNPQDGAGVFGLIRLVDVFAAVQAGGHIAAVVDDGAIL